ncbi:putative RNA-directed DNA polymerase [Helianthus annuus]|uniref:RNA-directed DNA polymerase n=1 Tax=Helianthus annuus TaxID=4232 RepID=A0A9K3I5T5_HELAN|nr:putative RNA-directed DNA polymerase [Helianthus annuus]
MLACKPVSYPIDQSHIVNNILNNNTGPLDNITGNQQLIGKLIYLSHTRPDIAYAIHFLSQYTHSPTDGCLKTAFHLSRYLKSAPGKGILFIKSDSFDLVAYADVDWAKCLTTRRSVTGYCVLLGNCLVSWKSKKQSTVSRSSAKDEFRAMCAASCEVIWLNNLLNELNIMVNVPINLFCDNTAALAIAANPMFHDRTKHFEIDLFFLRDCIPKGVIKCVGIQSTEQLADLFTEGQLVKAHNVLREKLKLFDLFKL